MRRSSVTWAAFAALIAYAGVATSGADFTAASQSTANAFVAAADFNTVTVSMSDPGTALRASVALQAVAASDRGIASVQLQSSPAGAGTWTNACLATVAPYTCNWDSAGVADGVRDFRAVAVDQAGYQRISASVTTPIDNTAPSSATVTDPGALFGGSKAIGGTAADAGSGIASWTLQYRTSPAGAWTDACSDTSASYSCSWVTTGVADGLYDLRAIARDGAANQTTSATLAGRRVDNTAPAVALADPGTPMTGTKSLTATASDAVAVQSVAFERSPAGAGTWTQICSDTTAAYTCSFATTAVTDGSYDLRAVAVDTAGNQSTSVVAARVVDNPPRGVDVQTANGGGTSGLLQNGDSISLTWSEPILPSSVLAGWTGASQAIRVSVANSAANDQMDFLTSSGAARLPLVLSATDLKLGGNFVTTAVSFNATMVRSGNTITVTLGSKISGTVTTAAVGTMTWRPSATATDATGKPSTTTTVTESGAADRDF
jgi:chitinase